jgi:hypothetical protein
MLEIFLFCFVLLCIIGVLLEWWSETRCLIPLLLCTAAQAQIPPPQVGEAFYLECEFYISTTGKDSAYMEPASIFMDSSEFFLIRGQDTTARRLCKFNPYVSQLELSCGDWVRPVRDYTGKVVAVWYGEKGTHYYFNKKFIHKNKPKK